MFIPPSFAENDRTTLESFIQQNSFGTLVSLVNQLPFATHLPFLLDNESSEKGFLIGHMAKGNPQWQEIANQTVLVIFTGPHTYISPSWYQDQRTVPTWNYTVVHVYGPIEMIHEKVALLDIVQRSVRFYEQTMPQPWSFDSTSVMVDRLLEQIVGFRISIEKLEGKFKLNQNHSTDRRQKVVQALKAQPDENSQKIAHLMANELSIQIPKD